MHIRLETIGDVTYGELAYFRKEQNPPVDYLGLIVRNNLLILFHGKGEELSAEILREVSSTVVNEQAEIKVGLLVYIFIHEILTKYAKTILSFREEIEDFATDFKTKSGEVNPDEFLESKSRLSDFSRVFEKLYFALNFLTVIQAIFVPLTLIAGIYGMNFQFMPELEFKYDYFITLGAMLLIAIGFIRYFYKNGWFK